MRIAHRCLVRIRAQLWSMCECGQKLVACSLPLRTIYILHSVNGTLRGLAHRYFGDFSHNSQWLYTLQILMHCENVTLEGFAHRCLDTMSLWFFSFFFSFHLSSCLPIHPSIHPSFVLYVQHSKNETLGGSAHSCLHTTISEILWEAAGCLSQLS